MMRWKMLAGCFIAAALVFIVVAVARVARGGDNAVVLALAGTFCGLAATFIALKAGGAKNSGDSGASPPA
jgi:hypothetical protein